MWFGLYIYLLPERGNPFMENYKSLVIYSLEYSCFFTAVPKQFCAYKHRLNLSFKKIAILLAYMKVYISLSLILFLGEVFWSMCELSSPINLIQPMIDGDCAPKYILY